VGLCHGPTRRDGNNRNSNNDDEPEGSSEFTPSSDSRWLAAPVFVHSLRAQHIVSAAISKAHGLALSAAGEIFSWGDNAHGELGVVVTSAAEVARNRATVVTTLANYRAVAASAGGQHSVAVCDRVAGHDGVVFAWGSNACGQLGVGSANKDPAAPPPSSSSSAFPRALVLHQVSTLRSLRIRQVACGSLHSLALSEEGQVYAWGCSDGGRLGLGNFGDSPKRRSSVASNAPQQSHTTPTRVGGVLSSLVALSVACGTWHSACVAATPSGTAQFGAGRVFTWGTGIYGQVRSTRSYSSLGYLSALMPDV
jgi:alpha-tubulin suppressor-like RCC1 family protein